MGTFSGRHESGRGTECSQSPDLPGVSSWVLWRRFGHRVVPLGIRRFRTGQRERSLRLEVRHSHLGRRPRRFAAAARTEMRENLR